MKATCFGDWTDKQTQRSRQCDAKSDPSEAQGDQVDAPLPSSKSPAAARRSWASYSEASRLPRCFWWNLEATSCAEEIGQGCQVTLGTLYRSSGLDGP